MSNTYIASRSILNIFYTYSISDMSYTSTLYVYFLFFIILSWSEIFILSCIPLYVCLNRIILIFQLILSLFFSFYAFTDVICYDDYNNAYTGSNCVIYQDKICIFLSILSIVMIGNITIGAVLAIYILSCIHEALKRSRKYFDTLQITIIGPEDNMCAICLEDDVVSDTKWKKLSCTHLFHPECIDEWFYKLNNNTCPICRKIETQIMIV